MNDCIYGENTRNWTAVAFYVKKQSGLRTNVGGKITFHYVPYCIFGFICPMHVLTVQK